MENYNFRLKSKPRPPWRSSRTSQRRFSKPPLGRQVLCWGSRHKRVPKQIWSFFSLFFSFFFFPENKTDLYFKYILLDAKHCPVIFLGRAFWPECKAQCRWALVRWGTKAWSLNRKARSVGQTSWSEPRLRARRWPPPNSYCRLHFPRVCTYRTVVNIFLLAGSSILSPSSASET